MRLIRQKNEIDCGIAVAAMLAGTTWKKAASKDKNPDSLDGLSVREFCAMCEALGSPVRVSVTGRRQPLRSADKPSHAAAAIIRQASKPRGHYIAIDGDAVLDPELGRLPLDRYTRAKWEVVRWFVRGD